ncbi:MAG: protein translocase subunit SecDF [Planctomycetaceae bacterium]|nr:protein translocase subunit SecDF [Planctomycetaceae bacterium]
MLSDFAFLAQAVNAAQAGDSTWLKALYILGVFIGCFILPFFVGKWIARSIRMNDHGWKIGLVLCTVLVSALIVYGTWDSSKGKFDIKLGVDLKGGVILIYEVDQTAMEAAADDGPDGPTAGVNMGALVEALARRINPSGTKEIVIRPYGAQQVEIIIPEVDQREVDQIKKQISTAGVLQFRIVGNTRDHSSIIEAARAMAEDPAKKRGRIIRSIEGDPVGLWAEVGREQKDGIVGPFQVFVAGDTIRNAATGEILDLSAANFSSKDNDDLRREFTRYVEGLGINKIDVLMGTDDSYNVTGSHLGAVSRGNDESLRPCIFFNLKADSGGVQRFANLTTEYGPEGGFNRQLGIVLDNTLLSAPNIQEPITGGRGRITGQFTKEEVAFLVNILEAGSLPVILNPNPISESQINPLLGAETIQQGKVAISLSLVLVLVFIAIYYRFSGVVACTALVLNLLFILALMILIKAAFTLPGLAGLVLTVGMSVDANVLIFERIREELSRGAALRMAIRNGFARATTTIVDANVTTLITAIVLYGIGTDQIRGFAVTLILGILMSMFTAIFCSRIAFDIAERTKWLTRLNMMQILTATQIDFIGKRRLAGVFSLLLIGVGIAAIAGRQADMFDIDFRGGASVQMRLESPLPTEEVRSRLEQQLANSGIDFMVTALKDSGSAADTNFKVDALVEEVKQLEDAIRQAFMGSGGQSQLATYSLKFGELHEVALVTPSTSEADESAPEEPKQSASEAKSEESAAAPSGEEQSSASELPNDQLAFANDAQNLLLAQADTEATTPPATTERAAEVPPAEVTSEADLDDISDESSGESVPSSMQTEVDLDFKHAINEPALRGEIELAAEELDIPVSYFELVNPNWDGAGSNAFTSWSLKMSADAGQTRALLEHVEKKFANSPVWAASSKIGSQVAGRMKQKAAAAFIACLFGIVVYIWIRFQRVIFGLAAVVALVHDVLVTLGAIAVSAWFANSLGFLLIEEFKISLPIVAALLTIVGYSLNDTIVVFDRIREVRGKSSDLTGDMINRSINQTLSRTMLTSITTLVVVVILYAMGGSGIHGFAFSLVVGVAIGTYSSIFVASPALLWMTGANKPAKASAAA